MKVHALLLLLGVTAAAAESPILFPAPACPVFPGGEVPCPQDCAVIKRVDENGCEVCECDPDNPGNPFVHPPFQLKGTVCPYPEGKAPCPADCGIIRRKDENGCEVCECDPVNPGNPFGPPPKLTICPVGFDGGAPCPMDCAVIRRVDENGCEVCECDPNNPWSPFGPVFHHKHRVRRSRYCPGKGEAPCPMDCGIHRYQDGNGCEVCECDPVNPGNPFGPYVPPPPPPYGTFW